jgi:hypothetical protein
MPGCLLSAPSRRLYGLLRQPEVSDERRCCGRYRPRLLGAGEASPSAIRRRLRVLRAGAGRRLVPVRRARAAGAGFHLRADERDSRALASRNRCYGERGGGEAGSPVFLDALRAGGGSGRGAGRAGARPAALDPAVDRRGGERGGDPDGQAGHGEVGDRRLRAILARHDRRRGGSDLQGRAARHRAAGGGVVRDSGAEFLPSTVRRRGRRNWTTPSICSTGRAPATWPPSSPSRS